jgi:hypothetical protein
MDFYKLGLIPIPFHIIEEQPGQAYKSGDAGSKYGIQYLVTSRTAHRKFQEVDIIKSQPIENISKFLPHNEVVHPIRSIFSNVNRNGMQIWGYQD